MRIIKLKPEPRYFWKKDPAEIFLDDSQSKMLNIRLKFCFDFYTKKMISSSDQNILFWRSYWQERAGL